MPQITVTLEDDVYMDLVHNLPKGLKSKFVNRAIKNAIHKVCMNMGNAMHDYARKGEHAAHEKVNEMLMLRRENSLEMQDRYAASMHEDQQKLGGEEE